MQSLAKLAQYIGTPFRLRGRSPETGWDCLGLVEYCQPLVIGGAPVRLLDLYAAPEARRSTTGMMRDAFTEARAAYRRIEKPIAGALVLFRTGRVPFHVGLYLRDGQFLHVRERCNTLISNLNDPDYERCHTSFHLPT